jgi:hypothetical protein
LLDVLRAERELATKGAKMSDPNNNQSSPPRGLEQAVGTMLDGLKTAIPAGVTEITVDQQKVTVPSLVQEFQGYSDTFTAVDAARIDVDNKIKARRTVEPVAQKRLGDVRDGLRVALGKSNALLKKFGIKPTKSRTPLTTEQKVLMKARIIATRKARGTTSKKQKLEIKGTPVESVTVDKTGKVTANVVDGQSQSQGATGAANGSSNGTAPNGNGAAATAKS